MKDWVADSISAEDFYGPISGWDTSKVTDMSRLFKGAKYLDDDISRWDVSNVTDIEGMFSGALNFNQSIGTWKSGNVTDIRFMFKGTSKQIIGA